MKTISMNAFKGIIFIAMVLALFTCIYILISQFEWFTYLATWSAAATWLVLSPLYRRLNPKTAPLKPRIVAILGSLGGLFAILTGVFGFFVPALTQSQQWYQWVGIIDCILLIILGVLLLITRPMIPQSSEVQGE